MSSKVAITFVEARVFSHATEDWNKVQKAMENLVTQDFLQGSDVERQDLQGYYGNPITLLKVRSHEHQQSLGVIRRIFSSLTPIDRNHLLDSFRDQMDENRSLYVRFDKQAAFLGNLRLGEEDVIRLQIKLSLPKKKTGEIEEAFRRIIAAEF